MFPSDYSPAERPGGEIVNLVIITAPDPRSELSLERDCFLGTGRASRLAAVHLEIIPRRKALSGSMHTSMKVDERCLRPLG